MKKHQKNHFWNIALFTRFNLVMGVKSYSVKVVVVVLYFETLQVCFPTSHTLHYTLQV